MTTGNKKTTEEATRSPIDGTELIRLATTGNNWKATLQSIFDALSPTAFLTPQMFGAIGDGSTDDSSAIAAAFASAATLKRPLLVTGGKNYAIDSVPLASNLTVIGDRNSGFKLKNNATGGMFVWPPAATTDNVTFRGINIDGNITGQSGHPHNLIHSIFFGVDGTCVITNSLFEDIYAHEIDGMLFGGEDGSNPQHYYDSVFRNIRAYHWTQNNFTVQITRSLVDGWNGDNETNNLMAFSGQGNAYGFAPRAIDSVIRGVRIKMSLTAQTTAGGGTVGIAITTGGTTEGNNVLTDCDVDSVATSPNFAYSIDGGNGNKCCNLIARNGIYNCDYEIFSQTDFQGSNWSSVNSLGSNVGIVWRDLTNVTLNGYTFRGTTNNVEAMFTQNTIDGLTISNYDIDTAYSAIRVNTGTNVILRNGVVKNCVVAFDGNSSTAINWTFDGLSFDANFIPNSYPWDLTNTNGITLSNILCKNMAFKDFAMNNVNDARYNNIRGVDFVRQPIGAGNIRCLRGTFDGGRISTYYTFGAHGGAIGTINLGVLLPKGAVVTRVYTVSSTTFTSNTSTAKVSFGVTSTPEAFILATVITNARFVAGNPTFGIMDGSMLTNYFYNDAEQQITMTVTIEPLTAGQTQIVIDYDMLSY